MERPWREVAAEIRRAIPQGDMKPLAARLELSLATLSRYLSGTRTPRLELMQKIAREAGLDLGTLVGQSAIVSRPAVSDPRIPETLAAIARIETELSDLRKSLTGGAKKMTMNRPDPDQWRHLAERMFEAAGDHVPTPAEVEQFAECFRRVAVAGARTGQTEWIIAGIAQQCGPDVAEHAERLIRAILSPKKMER